MFHESVYETRIDPKNDEPSPMANRSSKPRRASLGSRLAKALIGEGGRFWKFDAWRFAELGHPSVSNSLHPRIRDMVLATIANRTRDRARRILDFGSGDGRLWRDFPINRINLSLYDINARVLAKARKSFEDNVTIIEPDQQLPTDRFDVVVCSLVLMTLPSEAEVLEALGKMHGCLRSGGKAIIAITHPCFRAESFSDFMTDYSAGVPFDYSAEGRPFSVTISDTTVGKSVSFYDYHWSFEHTLNALVSRGLRFVRAVSVQDDPKSPKRNLRTPPFLIIEAVKP